MRSLARAAAIKLGRLIVELGWVLGCAAGLSLSGDETRRILLMGGYWRCTRDHDEPAAAVRVHMHLDIQIFNGCG